MADITVTNAKVLKFETAYDSVLNAADEDVANKAQKFIVTPNANDNQTLLRVTVANTHGAVAMKALKGDFWMGVEDKTISLAQNKTHLIQLETAKYLTEDGTIEIQVTPADGTRLTSDHALKVEVDSLL